MPAPVSIHIRPAGDAGGLTVQEHPEWDRRSRGCGPHDEVEVARVEAERDAPSGLIRHRRMPGDRPATRERPVIQAEPGGRHVDVGLVEPRDVAWANPVLWP